MKRFPIQTRYRRLLADTVTPVSLYLRLRDQFANTILLESSDYHGNDNTYSFLCFSPLASFQLSHSQVAISYPDGSEEERSIKGTQDLPQLLQEFLDSFQVEELDFKFSYNGLFGYQSYDTVRHYETVELGSYTDAKREIPDMLYHAYRYMIVINHFNNELYLFEHSYGETTSQLDHIEQLLNHQAVPRFTFSIEGEEETNLTDEEFLDITRKGQEHCQLGDVFQIVLSRQYQQHFSGDEFNLYRALRSVNPSPYLFYCDYGDFKIMGSSPEAQLVITKETATIHPIAGTFRRTGNDEEDSRLARELFDDPKENSEHVMLVDLARNDLSRNGSDVKVETYKEVQYFSHVIHLVSKVTANIRKDVSSLQLVADTFPAGTLSGAPKHRAMQLIEQYENQNRGFYGGSIGYLGFDGTFNQAIMIRSFLSKNNVLYYQAGAGIVSKSIPESELQEVHNKLAALRSALGTAEGIGKPGK
jgi:anthranilate synthase component 1